MARIVVASSCYLGDVAPFVAPANELASRGHDVTFLAGEGFRSVLTGEQFAFTPYPLDFSSPAMHADREHQRLMRHPWVNQMRLPRYWMRKGLVDDPDACRRGLLEVLEGADALVTHPTFGSATIPVADHLGIPAVVGQLFPMMMPTRHHSAPMTGRSLRAFGPLNTATWVTMMRLSAMMLNDREINAFRGELGRQRQYAAAFTTWMDAAATVMLVSRHYFGEPPDDWPPMVVGGFSSWSGPASAPTPAGLEDFLESGDAPVLVTMGTSAAASAGERFAAIARGLDRLGLRSLHLVADERNLPPLAGRSGVFVFAPLGSVLPRCRIAVVSGALGALSTALLRGVPVVVVPQIFDQVWHGHQVEELGVGIMAHTPRGVVQAVKHIEADGRYRARAVALANAMKDEDGARTLADAVESVLA